MRFVYLINKEGTDEYKIGIGVNPEKRIKTLQTGNGETLILVNKFCSNFSTKIEVNLHKKYYSTHKHGEWFYLDNKDVNEFTSLCEKYEKSFSYLNQENCFFKKEIEKLKY
jgi:hypothetical protein